MVPDSKSRLEQTIEDLAALLVKPYPSSLWFTSKSLEKNINKQLQDEIGEDPELDGPSLIEARELVEKHRS